MRVGNLLAGALAVLLALPALAAEGRIPLPDTSAAPPYILSAPGSYVLTRDILAFSGPILEIVASDVEVDLNGFALELVEAPEPVIRAIGVERIRIRNGILRGGLNSVLIDRGALPVSRGNVVERIQSVAPLADGIVLVGVDNFVVTGNRSENASGIAFSIDSSTGTSPSVGGGLVSDNSASANVVQPAGIIIKCCKAVIVANNRLKNVGIGVHINGAAANCAGGARACVVRENAIQKTNTQGILLQSASGCNVIENVIDSAGTHGIEVDLNSFANLVHNNTVHNSGVEGIFIAGDENHIERNLTNLNSGFGLRFGPLSTANVYRGNTARGNTAMAAPPCAAIGTTCGTDFCDDPVPGNNTSHGDNYVPGSPTLPACN